MFCKRYDGLQPKLRFPVRAGDMDMHPLLFTRKEKKSKILVAEDGLLSLGGGNNLKT
jgi:hypothetical protein